MSFNLDPRDIFMRQVTFYYKTLPFVFEGECFGAEVLRPSQMAIE